MSLQDAFSWASLFPMLLLLTFPSHATPSPVIVGITALPQILRG